jgi:alanyl-tRNA synthetase
MFINHFELRQKFFEFFESKGHKIQESASLIPENDPSLLFNSAGMVPFKDAFLGRVKVENKRVATIQKCIRTNDIENIGVTSRHLSFFEMIGNFSFGDYFKKEAIEYAWEFLTEIIGLSKEKLYITVYNDDDEAFEIWEKIVGKDKISRLGEDSNFWTIGKVGPCGPCSEILFDKGEEFGCKSENCKPGCDCDRYLEVWNLVFTQFDKQEDGSLKPLAQKNIDTGMGLERILSVIQNVESVFDTDIFKNIGNKVLEISEVRKLENKPDKKAVRIISDHLRSAVFLIADGVFPANEGRGYVLKRLIRRAIRQGNKFGIYGFLVEMAERVVETMGSAYPYLLEKKNLCLEILDAEEKKFSSTISNAEKVFEEIKEKCVKNNKKIISGIDAFKLFDTYGLPLDLIEELAEESNLSINKEEYDIEMQKQKEKSRNIVEGWDVNEDLLRNMLNDKVFNFSQEFFGYSQNQVESEILALVQFEKDGIDLLKNVNNETGEFGIVLKKTTFYAESGGQKSDFGNIEIYDAEKKLVANFKVNNSKKYVLGTENKSNWIISFGRIDFGSVSIFTDLNKKYFALAKIDVDRRNSIMRNHTATHLLQAVLRENLGKNVEQAGSEVRSDGFRFDFTYQKAIEEDVLKKIEREVNNIILKNYMVNFLEMNLDEAKKIGAMALFDEKYGDKVRVVKIGNSSDWNDNISIELCGGTHVKNTSEIGLFKIISESSVANGVRRIEGITGLAVYDMLCEKIENITDISKILKVSQDRIPSQIENILDKAKIAEKKLETLNAKIRKSDLEKLISENKESAQNKNFILVSSFEDMDMNSLRNSMDFLKDKLKDKTNLLFLVAKNEDKINAILSVSDDFQKKYNENAKSLMKQVTDKFGGGGGGRDNMVQAGLKTTENLDVIIAFAKNIFQKFD